MPNEVSSMLGIKPKTLEAWRVAGEGPPSKRIGRLLRYDPADLAIWMKEHHKTDSSAGVAT